MLSSQQCISCKSVSLRFQPVCAPKVSLAVTPLAITDSTLRRTNRSLYRQRFLKFALKEFLSPLMSSRRPQVADAQQTSSPSRIALITARWAGIFTTR